MKHVNKNRIALFAILLSFIVGCTPIAKKKLTDNRYQAWPSELGYGLIEEEDTTSVDGVYIGELYIGDGGMTLQCDYTTMLDILKNEAFDAGANVIKITKVKTPDFLSTCYRIKADLYYAADYKEYEKAIYWTKERNLAIEDYKASSDVRPDASRSLHKITYGFHRTKKSRYWHLKFKTIFYCEGSYFNERKADENSLKKEQLLFDIGEKYARLMVKEMRDRGVVTYKIFLKEAEDVLTSFSEKWDLERDRYLTELQESPTAYDEWRVKIDADLEKLEELAKKRLLIKA